jgi:hypothetical protein
MLSDKPSAQKKKVVSTRIFGETGCNHILEHFLLVKSPTKGLNVLKIPFREVTPGVGEHFKPGARKGQSDRLASSWNKDSQPEALLCPRLDSGDPPDALSYDLSTRRSSRRLADRGTDFHLHRFRIRKKDYVVLRLGRLACQTFVRWYPGMQTEQETKIEKKAAVALV